MANQIRLKRASGSDPGASDLVTGEIAVRTDTGKIFTKKDDNSVVEVGVGISDVVDDTSPQLGGDLQSNGNDIDFADGDKAVFGAGSDLQILHDGNNSRIEDQGTGYLEIRSNNVRFENAAANEALLYMSENGAVQLYFDNSKKFQTENAGVSVFGNLYQNDDYKLILGNSSDLEIYHSSSNAASYIQNSTGNLFIEAPAGSAVQLRKDGTTEVLLKAIPDGAVELYHDNSKKFETASYGGSITGNLGIGVSGTPQDVLDLGNASGGRGIAWGGSSGGNGHYATIYTEYSSANLILGAGVKGSTSSTDFIAPYTGNLGNSIIELQAFGDDGMIFYVDADASRTAGDTITPTERLRINTAGDVKVPDNGKFVCGASNDLQIYHDGTDTIIDNNTGNLNLVCDSTQAINLKHGSENMIRAITDGAVELYYDNSKKFETTSDGVKIKNTITMEEASGSEAYQFSVNSFGGLDINNETTKIAEFTDSSTFNLLDNVKITCGTGSDLEIYHNGSHSIIDNSNGTGDLKLIGDDVIIQAGNDDIMAKFIQDGAVELYHNNSKKLETDSVGTIFADDIFFADNLKVNLGNSSDLQLLHNGSHSQIVNITGHLLIGSERIKLTNPAHGHVYLDATLAGSVDLYHNNSKKFETTSSGVSVTGGVTASGASTFNEDVTFTGTNVNIVFDKTADAFEFADNAEARFGNSDDFRIIHDGTYNNLKGTGAHGMRFFTNNTERMRLTSAGVLQPAANATYDLGTSSLRWNNLFVNDMHLANSPDNPNKVDGTWGDWTLQEGEDTIYMLNNRNGKQYKMNLTEV